MRWAQRSSPVARHHVPAKGSSSANDDGRSASGMDGSLVGSSFGSMGGNPIADDLVEVTDQDLLIAQREVAGDHARLERPLGAFQRADVLQRELLEHHDGALPSGAV